MDPPQLNFLKFSELRHSLCHQLRHRRTTRPTAIWNASLQSANQKIKQKQNEFQINEINFCGSNPVANGHQTSLDNTIENQSLEGSEVLNLRLSKPESRQLMPKKTKKMEKNDEMFLTCGLKKLLPQRLSEWISTDLLTYILIFRSFEACFFEN